MPSDTVTVRAHEMDWLCEPEFAETLPLLDLEPLRHADSLPEDVLVKDNMVRTVARVRSPDGPDRPGLYVKRFKSGNLFRRLVWLVRKPKPLYEWEIDGALQTAGVPACHVLAVGVRRAGRLTGEGWLVSREIAGAQQLNALGADWSSLPGPFRSELLGELARRSAQLLDAGFYHHDFHAANILIRPDAPPGERVWIVDLYSVRRRRIRRRHALRMLARLAVSPEAPQLTGEEWTGFLERFLEAWQGGPGCTPQTMSDWSRAVEKARATLYRHRARSRTKRCLAESSLFTAGRAGGFAVRRRLDFPVQAALDAVECHRRAVAGECEAGSVHRTGRRTEVTLVPCRAVPPRALHRKARPGQMKPGRICVKAFRRDSWRERLKDALRPHSRASSGWVAHRGFQVRGVPAAQAIALLESHRRLAGEPDYLIVQALENDGTLLDLVTGGGLSAADRRALGTAVADLLRGMADEGVYHPDTKPTNILVRRTPDGFGLWLVDLDRARFGVRFGARHWAKCLMRVNAQMPWTVTLLDRMRCLRRCSEGRWTPRERLALAREVARLSYERMAGRRRPVQA